MLKWKFKFKVNPACTRDLGTRVPARKLHTWPGYIDTRILPGLVGTLFSVSRAGVGNLQPAGCKQPPDLQRKQNPRALPYVDQYHLPVNRPLDPFFDSNLTPNDLVFSPHPKIPFYKIECKISNFSHAFGTFVNYQLKITNFHSNLTQSSPNKHTSKNAIFFKPHSLYAILHQVPVSFSCRHIPDLPVTFIFECHGYKVASNIWQIYNHTHHTW